MTRWFPEDILPIDVVNATREPCASGIVSADEIAAELVFDFGIDASGLTADVVAAALRTGNLQGREQDFLWACGEAVCCYCEEPCTEREFLRVIAMGCLYAEAIRLTGLGWNSLFDIWLRILTLNESHSHAYFRLQYCQYLLRNT